jgi:hypothetical protein
VRNRRELWVVDADTGSRRFVMELPSADFDISPAAGRVVFATEESGSDHGIRTADLMEPTEKARRP